jgi:hypothetical protein
MEMGSDPVYRVEALKEQGASVAEAAFSHAFKRVTELSPGAVRRGGVAGGGAGDQAGQSRL